MYKTDRLYLNNLVPRTEDCQLWVSEFAAAVGLPAREAVRLSLLAEETVGMIYGIVSEFEAELWLEGDRESGKLYLDVLSGGAPDQKAERRIPAGFMAKVGEMLQCAFRFEGEEDVPDAFWNAIPGYLKIGAERFAKSTLLMGRWSLNAYRQALRDKQKEGEAVADALDELEKSIVASIADDVTVGVKDQRIRLVITRKFEQAG